MKIRLKNFRSLIDTGDIALKPITVLIGKNSSGKSSFIRTFPLLKQSAQERTRSPILLYGNYVDFGSYADIKPKFKNVEEEAYSLIFTIDINEFIGLKIRNKPTVDVRSVKGEVEYSVEFKEDKKQSLYIHKVIVTFLKSTFILNLNTDRYKIDSFIVNDDIIFNENDNIKYSNSGGFSLDLYTTSRVRRERFEDFVFKKSIVDFIKEKILLFLQTYISGNTSNVTAWGIVRNITIDNDENILLQLKNCSNLVIWNKRIKNWKVTSSEFIRLKNLLIAYYIQNSIVEKIDLYLTMVSHNIKYLAPLRATAERYYRIQHLAVDEVDPNGKNLPIFIDSLTDAQLVNFNEWTEENFKFKVKIQKTEGHYSIIIIQGETAETNLSDMGFGYSQILPILTQIWHSTTSQNKNFHFYSSRNVPQIIAIEQPELHLHPEFQAKFADAIVKLVKYSQDIKMKISLIIETHSDIIINRLGECVQDDEIKNSDIEIVIFDKEESGSPTKIKKSYFDDHGRLNDWPFGFFQPSRKG